jgi:hypothetical protein
MVGLIAVAGGQAFAIIAKKCSRSLCRPAQIFAKIPARR